MVKRKRVKSGKVSGRKTKDGIEKISRVYRIVGILIVIGLLSLLSDATTIQFAGKISNPVLDLIFTFVTLSWFGISLLGIVALSFIFIKNKRKYLLPLTLTVAFSWILGYVLKLIVQRPRPFQEGLINTPLFLQQINTDFSFPSIHAILAFCALPLVIKEYPKLKYPAIIIACLVAFSRFYFGLHYLSDILVGGALGYLIGYLVLKFIEKKLEKGHTRRR